MGVMVNGRSTLSIAANATLKAVDNAELVESRRNSAHGQARSGRSRATDTR
jgi:hypothetical protein